MTPVQRRWQDDGLPAERPRAFASVRDWEMLMAHVDGDSVDDISARVGLSRRYALQRIRRARYRLEAIQQWGTCPLCRGTGRNPTEPAAT